MYQLCEKVHIEYQQRIGLSSAVVFQQCITYHLYGGIFVVHTCLHIIFRPEFQGKLQIFLLVDILQCTVDIEVSVLYIPHQTGHGIDPGQPAAAFFSAVFKINGCISLFIGSAKRLTVHEFQQTQFVFLVGYTFIVKHHQLLICHSRRILPPDFSVYILYTVLIKITPEAGDHTAVIGQPELHLLLADHLCFFLFCDILPHSNCAAGHMLPVIEHGIGDPFPPPVTSVC